MDRKSWLEWRHLGIGSSDAPALMGVSPWKTRKELWIEKTSPVQDEKSSFIMEKGNRLEPIARKKFEAWHGLNYDVHSTFEPKLCESVKYPFLKASLDGANEDTFIEIKYQGKADFELQEVPEKYIWQLYHQFLVSGYKRAFFVGINDDEEIKVLPFEPNEKKIRRLLAEEIMFWDYIQHKIEPESEPDDRLICDDIAANNDAEAFLVLDKEIKRLEELRENLREKLILYCDHPKMRIGKLNLTEVERIGNVNYSKIPELKGVDLNKYRAKSSKGWRITIGKE